MARTIPILAISGSILGALAATVFIDLALMLPALFAVGGGIYLAISKDWRRWVPGALAILLAVLGVMGTIGSVGGEDGAIEFPISIGMGAALLVLACLMFPSVVVLQGWGSHEPAWLSMAFAGIILLAELFALIFSSGLGDQSNWQTLVIAILALGALWPSIVALRE